MWMFHCPRPRILPAFVLGLLLSLGGTQAHATETLKGYLEKQAEVTQDALEGQVLDSQTNQPIPGADVTLPDQGFKMKTNANGEYQIPRFFGKHPVIMSVQKPGYAPFSMTITENAPPRFYIRLNKQSQMLVLDAQLRHLGDGSFSMGSSNAFQFRKPPDGPGIRIPFTLGDSPVSANPYLTIGSIIGLDTPMVHYLTGNQIGANASPLLVKLNGATIARIQVNGDNQHVAVPAGLLKRNTQNVLEIEAGFHYPEPGRLDYDDMELMNLVLHL